MKKGVMVSNRRRREGLVILVTIVVAAMMATRETAGASSPMILRGATLIGSAVSYSALRHLEAWSVDGDANGWLEALTVFDGAGLRVQVLRSGGTSERIRTRVLPQVLETEQEAWRRGNFASAALTPQNYSFSEAPGAADVLGVRLIPLRREPTLVDGVAWLHNRTGQLVRVQGQLAKSPSFWITRVEIDRRFECVTGHMLPVASDAVAWVKLVGAYRFKMTYRYQSVDGRPAIRRPGQC